jgi:hypothetical protein
MVWLSGWRNGATKPIVLHDPPPGYRPPQMSPKDRRRMARQDWVLMRFATVVLVIVAAAFIVISLVLIATHI